MAEEEIKELYIKPKELLKNKKVQWAIIAIVFLIILFLSTTMRLSNLPLLVDHTTGNYTLSDPDALYWLRLEGHLLQYGNLNGIDTMRYGFLNVTYTHEMLAYLVVNVYKIISSFNPSITYQFIDASYPAYAFAISLIIFFFLVYILTKSKTAAGLASAFLAFSPVYLFRTVSGVSGHEALGIMFSFAVFLAFVLGLKNFHKSWKQTTIYGILIGFLTACSFAAWGGVINFIFLILPLTLLLYYLFNIEHENNKLKLKFILFYFVWIIASLLSTFLVNFNPFSIYSIFFTASGVLVPAVLLFIIIDLGINHFTHTKKIKFKLLISGLSTILLGILGLQVLGKGGFSLIGRIYNTLLHPLGTNRVGLTVAYYAQPYLTDFQSQVMMPFFWLFVLGSILICIEMIKGLKSLKHKVYLGLLGIVSILGILFSRYSSSSIFNGVDLVSQLIYFLGFVILIGGFIFMYYKDKHKIDETIIFIFCWMLVMLVTIRAAERTIFMVAPFMALISAYFIVKTASYMINAKGQDRKYIFFGIFIIALLISFVYLFGNPFGNTAGAYQITSAQAPQIGPLTNDQWQNAMAWVRNNTSTDSIFLHWWDYGYILQTIGLRPSVLDGGNYNSYWDHLMGRYVLTTPNPNTALAFMKAQDVSYLLIDFTDFGKYSAYSTIGSDSSGIDRFAAPGLVVANPTQDYNNSNGTIRIFQGQTFVDQDIFYNGIFLPGISSQNGQPGSANAYFIGVSQSYTHSNNSLSLQQPTAVFLYNGQQYPIPMKYIYFNGKVIDFGSGINATFMIIPNINPLPNGQIQMDPIGAGIYLSPKVQQGLYARLYLMNDAYNQYPTLTLANVQENYLIKALAAQGLNFGEFADYQGQLLAPLKIWKVSIPQNILLRTEFREPSGRYASLDNLTLTS